MSLIAITPASPQTAEEPEGRDDGAAAFRQGCPLVARLKTYVQEGDPILPGRREKQRPSEKDERQFHLYEHDPPAERFRPRRRTARDVADLRAANQMVLRSA